jgi:hypothetical protein
MKKIKIIRNGDHPYLLARACSFQHVSKHEGSGNGQSD